jgi:hypothetical protein
MFLLFLLLKKASMKMFFLITSFMFLATSVKAQSVVISTSTTTTNEAQRTKYVSVYPNPSAEVMVIKVNEPKTGMEFLLYNQLGEVVDKLAIVEKETQYVRRNLAKGIYTFSVISNKEVVESGKIVFE